MICSEIEEQVEIRSGEKRKMERPAMIYSLEMAALTKPQEILIWSHQDEEAWRQSQSRLNGLDVSGGGIVDILHIGS